MNVTERSVKNSSRLGLRILFVIVTLGMLITHQQALGQQLRLHSDTSNTQFLSTPRKAVHTFLHWQQEGHKQPHLVIQTMQLAQNRPDEQKLELAKKLLSVLDARGLIIRYEQIPAQPAYTDSLSGLHQYILFPSLPEVYLVRHNGQWMFSKATIEHIPELYREHFSAVMDTILNSLPQGFHQQWMGLMVWQYAAIFVWIILGLIIQKLFTYFLENYGRRAAQTSRTIWDDRLIHEIERPLGLVVIMIFFWLTYTNLMLDVTVNYYLSTFFEIAVSAAFIWLLYNLSNVLSDYLSSLTGKTESKLDDQLVPLIRKTLKIFIVILGVLFVLQNHGINVASLLAGLGLGGLAFALAARDTLANFFGSITIFLDKPFQIGDWIKTQSVEGTVEEVGFRSTRIRTFHNSLISVPNANMADAEVDNLGLREFRRIKSTINLTYSTTPEQMEAFVEGIKAIIKANSNFRQDFYEVHFNNFGAHSLEVLVYCFLKVETWSDELQQRHNFFIEIVRLAKQVGVEFAFPTQTLHVDSFYGDEPREAGTPRSEDELAEAIYAFGPDGKLGRPEGINLEKNGEKIDFGASLKRSGS